MQVWITGYRGFLGEAIGLFVDKAELYFRFWALPFSELRGLELKLHKGQGLHVIWAGKSSVNPIQAGISKTRSGRGGADSLLTPLPFI